MERNLIEFRPLNITEIIAAALRSLYRNPSATLLISLNFSLILGLVSLLGLYFAPLNEDLLNELIALSETGSLDPIALENLLTQIWPLIIFLIISTFLLYLFQGVITGILAPVIGFLVTGSKLTRNETWMRSKKQLGKLFVLSFAILIIEIISFVAPIFLISAISVLFPQTIASLLVTAGLIMSLVLLILVWTSLLLAPVILILENTSIKLSFLRSNNLVKKNFFRIFFGTLWALIIGQALAFFGQLPFSLISSSVQDLNQLTTFSVFSETLGAVVGYMLLLSFFASYLCLLYTDQRIRHENLANNLKSAMGR